ncbi:amino acid permease [Bacteriovorax sp. BAL6_X]|uniref:APC family permease n=1 Tax=Bacteriovorax sp. BAL6_X TaxID=1201290 RepID=UPI000385D6AA|nr:amino acid permease [Bacteriovorax sp. BAL6_X]EPZ51957.1 amino acid permease [Bacteriovorax sp. BAL6_X]
MVKLKRTLNTFQVSLYGIGTILGAGIYSLIGKISATSGVLAPVSFMLSALIASLTAISYSQLVKLHPKSAGEAEYVYQGFKNIGLSNLVGWLVAFTGVISASTLTKAFIGYFKVLIDIPNSLIATLVILVITLLAIKGIKESINLIIIFTLIEVTGLILVCLVAWPELVESNFMIPKMLENISWDKSQSILAGAFIAFYAFIGFEDMVNLAEETTVARVTISRSIYIALITSTILYILVAIVAISSIPLNKLNTSPAPIKDMYVHHGGDPFVIGLIGSFAIFNGIMAQVIMGSRILYGLRHPFKWMSFLSVVNKKTKTPINATIVIAVVITILISFFELKSLAMATSFIILIIFTLVNTSLVLIRIKNRQIKVKYLWTPILAVIVNILFLII